MYLKRFPEERSVFSSGGACWNVTKPSCWQVTGRWANGQPSLLDSSKMCQEDVSASWKKFFKRISTQQRYLLFSRKKRNPFFYLLPSALPECSPLSPRLPIPPSRVVLAESHSLRENEQTAFLRRWGEKRQPHDKWLMSINHYLPLSLSLSRNASSSNCCVVGR